jgi:hypothetical protein
MASDLARNQQSANEAIVTSRVAPKFSGRSRHAAPERASVDLAVLVNHHLTENQVQVGFS